MIELWIGCSGFHYKEWKEIFYPAELPQRKWFEFYSQHFNTLELNTTFYRFPRVHALQKWYDVSPAVYRFSVKAPRLITHYKRFKDSKRMLSDFYGTIREGLRDKLGGVLFQLPRASYSEEMLDRIIENMDPGFQNVIEFRDESWWKAKVRRKLSMHGIHFCSVSFPGLPDSVFAATELVYYRFHGIPVIYKSTYKRNSVTQAANDLMQAKKVRQAFIYFNNTWGVGAIKNGRQLQVYCNTSANKKSFSLPKST